MKTITLFSAALFACFSSFAQVHHKDQGSSAASPDPALIEPQSSRDSLPPTSEVFVYVEQMPEFPGGNEAMLNYLAKNIRYPAAAREQNLQGKVFLSFVVSSEGNIYGVELLRAAINDGAAANETTFSPAKQAMIDEAIRVVKSMPKWRPGKNNGHEINCKFTLPISFVLK